MSGHLHLLLCLFTQTGVLLRTVVPLTRELRRES